MSATERRGIPEGERILSRLEVDALLKAINAGDVPVGGAPPAGPVVPVDFRRPQRLTAAQLRRLEALHEPLVRPLRDLLTSALRTAVDARAVGAVLLTLAEMADAMPGPCAVAAGAVEPGGSPFLVILDHGLAFALVERLLGAGGALEGAPDRPLRDLEWTILDRVVERFLEMLCGAWPAAGERLSLRARDSSLRAFEAAFLPGGAVRLGFAVEFDGRRCALSLAVPEALAEELVAERGEGSAVSAATLSESLRRADVGVAARLPEVSLALTDLQALSPGDVLHLGLKKDAEVILEVGGAPKLSGRLGRTRGRRAVAVERWLEAPPRTGGVAAVERRAATTRRGGAPRWAEALRAEVELRAVVARFTARLRDVLELRPGSVLALPRAEGDPVRLEIAGRSLGSGRVVRAGQRLAVQLSELQDPKRTVRSLG